MAINLTKGQKVDLTKGRAGLSKLIVGLGWDEVKKKGLFGAKAQDIDCDASAVLLVNGKFAANEDVVYFRNLTHFTEGVLHQGDNLTGAGEGDDEQIFVILDKIPTKYSQIVFVVNIFQAKVRKQHFGLVQNAYIRIVDASNNQEMCRFNLSESYDGMTAMIFGELYRKDGEWKFNAIGQPTDDPDLFTLVNRFQ